MNTTRGISFLKQETTLMIVSFFAKITCDIPSIMNCNLFQYIFLFFNVAYCEKTGVIFSVMFVQLRVTSAVSVKLLLKMHDLAHDLTTEAAQDILDRTKTLSTLYS